MFFKFPKVNIKTEICKTLHYYRLVLILCLCFRFSSPHDQLSSARGHVHVLRHVGNRTPHAEILMVEEISNNVSTGKSIRDVLLLMKLGNEAAAETTRTRTHAHTHTHTHTHTHRKTNQPTNTKSKRTNK